MIDWEMTAWVAAAAGIGVAIALAAMLLGVGWAQRQLRSTIATESDLIRSRLSAQSADLATLSHALVELRETVGAINAHLEQPTHINVTQAPANGRAYELAARLAGGGAAAHELMDSCGLTRAEADLTVLVHGSRDRAAAH